MGLKLISLLYWNVARAELHRVVRAFAPKTMARVCNSLYGEKKWCVLWDLAVDRLRLHGRGAA